MRDFTHKLRVIFGNLIMFCGILVLVLGTALLYAGAWFAGAPYNPDISTEDLKKMYREKMNRDKDDH